MGGNSYSVPSITSQDLERWHHDGRPVMIDQQRRQRSPGGRYHSDRQIRIVREGYGGGGSDRGFRYSERPEWHGDSSMRRGRDGSLSSLSWNGPSERPRPRPDSMFSERETGVRGWPGSFRVFGRRPQFERGPVIVEDWYYSIPVHRFAPPSGHEAHRRSWPPSSVYGPWDDVRSSPRHHSNPYRDPEPHRQFPHGHRTSSSFDHDYRGPYMSGGLGRGDPVGGARGGPAIDPERRRIGFRDELLLRDSRSDSEH